MMKRESWAQCPKWVIGIYGVKFFRHDKTREKIEQTFLWCLWIKFSEYSNEKIAMIDGKNIINIFDFWEVGK